MRVGSSSLTVGAATGGAASAVVVPPPNTFFFHPVFLPDGRHFIFSALPAMPDRTTSEVRIGALDSTLELH